MHREIQIKQFPIVTTHWWPKTRNERFVWENEQYLYRFLPLVHNHVQVIWVRTRIRCVTCVCARALAHAAFTRGVGVNAWRRACLKRGADATFQAPTEASANQIASCKYPIPFMQHQRSMWLVVVTMTARQHHASDTPSVKRWRLLYTCHYMTDRLERFDLKTSKLDLLKKKRHLHLGCPWGKLIDTKF